jgi:membrane-bound serine protease (ClpP class)
MNNVLSILPALGLAAMAAHGRQTVLRAVSDPDLALLLAVAGALCVYVEFCRPGAVVPGVAGALLTIAGLTGLARLPLTWLGLSLTACALVLFTLGARYAARGLPASAGAISMFFGAVRLIGANPAGLRIHPPAALAATLLFAPATAFLLAVAVRARRNKTGPETAPAL